MFENATNVEWIYTGLMSLALLTTALNLAWAQARLNELRKLGHNGMLLVIRRGARNDQALLTLISCGMVGIGVNLLFAPVNPRGTPVSMTVNAVLLLFLGVMMVVLSWNIRLRPIKLHQELEP